MQRCSPRGRPMIPFWITCVCVLGPWPWIFFVSLASILVSPTSPLVSCFHQCYNCWCQTISWSWHWVGKTGKVVFAPLLWLFYSPFLQHGAVRWGFRQNRGNRTCRPGARVVWVGWRGRKIFGGSHINFSLKFGGEDQKKVFIPNYAPRIRIVCLLLGHNSRFGNSFIAWWGVTESNGADLGSCQQIQGWRPKKAILGFVLAFTSVFVLERDFTHAWGVGAQAVFLGGTGPEMHSSGTGLVLSFGA